MDPTVLFTHLFISGIKTVKLFLTLLMKHPLSFADEYYKWIEKTFKVTLHPSIY